MISVEFKSVGAGTCAWCAKEKDEVFDIAFSDKSFVGLYCRGDLMKAVSVKCEKRSAKAAIPVQAVGLNNGSQRGESNGGGFGPPGGTTTETAKK